MEKKMKLMHKVMTSLLMASLVFWSWATNGLISFTTLLIVFIFAAVLISNKRQPGDERDWQINSLAAYGSFIVTICFLLIMQAVEYLKTSKVNPLFGYTMAVLMLSHLGFTLVLRKNQK